MDRDIQMIFERLRSGVVPERGLHHFEVGTERTRGELRRQLQLAKDKQGAFKFLRGGYGCGKTFSARLAINEALDQNFATSFVVVSDNDLRFHRFEELYRKIVGALATVYCDHGAFSTILDRWIGNVEDELIDLGEDEDSDEFDSKVLAKIEQQLHTATGGKVPQDMIRVLKTIFECKQARKLAEAGALISWLSGGQNVASAAKKLAGIKGDITSNDALDYLKGVLEIIKLAGFSGLVVVVDEVETILRSRKDTRNASLNGIRQIYDASDTFRGLLWLFTGTPEFFDTQKGVKGLQPLHDRVQFTKSGKFVNVMQPQLQLTPFDATRLRQVARNLRSVYPYETERVKAKVTDEFIDGLVAKYVEGFAGKVGIVPRHFLRKFVDILDLVHQEPDYEPDLAEKIELSTEEKEILRQEQQRNDEEEEMESVVF